MPHVTPDQLLARLAALGIDSTTHEHPAVFTVAESAAIKVSMPGGHSKNLFLKDKKGRLFLVVASHDTSIDLKRLGELLGASGRLSFGSGDLLLEMLGVTPGSVTPFALVNDTETRIALVLDARLMRENPVNFHPLVNTKTTAVSPEGLLAFLRSTGHEPRIMELPAPAPSSGS